MQYQYAESDHNEYADCQNNDLFYRGRVSFKALSAVIDRQEILIVSVIAVIVCFPELSIGHSRGLMLFLFVRRCFLYRCCLLGFSVPFFAI